MAFKRAVFNMQWLDVKLHADVLRWLSPAVGLQTERSLKKCARKLLNHVSGDTWTVASEEPEN